MAILSVDEETAAIYYYFIRDMPSHVANICQEGLKRRSTDPNLLFWNAVSLIKQGKYTEAIREVKPLEDKKDYTCASFTAQIYAHNHCSVIDSEAVMELEAKLTIASGKAPLTDRSFQLLSALEWHLGNITNARKHLTHLTNPMLGLLIQGWLDLLEPSTNNKVDKSKAAATGTATVFDTMLANNPRDVQALMGRSYTLRHIRNQLTFSLDTLSQIITTYPNFTPAYIEKMYLQMELNSWDAALETSKRVRILMPDALDSAIVECLHTFTRSSNLDDFVSVLDTLMKCLSKGEPNNHRLYLKLAQTFIRLSEGNSNLLARCSSMIEKAIDLLPTNPEYVSELGHIRVLQKFYPAAKEAFNRANSLDNSSPRVLLGLMETSLASGEFAEAEEQLNIYHTLQLLETPQMLLIAAAIEGSKNKNYLKKFDILHKALSAHLASLGNKPFSLDYYRSLDPVFLQSVLREMWSLFIIADDAQYKGNISEDLTIILDVLVKAVPGNSDAFYYFAKLKHEQGDLVGAKEQASKALKLNPKDVRVHLLLADIAFKSNNVDDCLSSLDMALSIDFEVRLIASFQLLKVKCLKMVGRTEEAFKLLNTTIVLPGVRSSNAQEKAANPNYPSDAERLEIFLELAESLQGANMLTQSAKILGEASTLFTSQADEDTITIQSADLALKRGAFEEAINYLSAVEPDRALYMEARKRMAKIYLDRNDVKAYAKCYADIVEKNGTFENCILLGDAYLTIHEPEKAIAVYKSSVYDKSGFPIVAPKIGNALIKTHEFEKAIKYYESAMHTASVNNHNMPYSFYYDFAYLYFRLRRNKDVVEVVKKVISEKEIKDDSNTLELEARAKLIFLASKAQHNLGDIEQAINMAMDCKELHVKAMSRVVTNPAEAPQSEMTKVLCWLGDLHSELRKFDVAISIYQEAMAVSPGNARVMAELAKLYIAINDNNAAQSLCTEMLKKEELNDEAILMIAEIQSTNLEYDAAIQHYVRLLDKNPKQFQALEALIDICRRKGTLPVAKKYFIKDIAAENVPLSSPLLQSSPDLDADYQEPGFYYCRGLYLRHGNQPAEALASFAKARKDETFGVKSIYHMIEIFLNPDNDTQGGHVLDKVADDANDQETAEAEEEMQVGQMSAQRLLKELLGRQPHKSMKVRLLEIEVQMLSKNKKDIESAVQAYLEILANDNDNVGALYGCALAYQLQKQTPKARNQLKRLAKLDWTIENAEDFERCWLLLADLYIEGGKFDLATDLLRKALAKNKSCVKACEYLGLIMEKEASYKDAAEQYARAFQLQGESNPVIGYKLAFNHLKAKRYVDAIDVARAVLNQFPDYPKIREEILVKARTGLKSS